MKNEKARSVTTSPGLSYYLECKCRKEDSFVHNFFLPPLPELSPSGRGPAPWSSVRIVPGEHGARTERILITGVSPSRRSHNENVYTANSLTGLSIINYPRQHTDSPDRFVASRRFTGTGIE